MKIKPYILAIFGIAALLIGLGSFFLVTGSFNGEKEEEKVYVSSTADNKDTEMVDVIYENTDCYRTVAREGYEVTSSLSFHYRNHNVQKAEFLFNLIKIDPDASDSYTAVEVEELNQVDSPGFVFNQEDNKYNIEIDFKEDKTLLEHPTLKQYTYVTESEIDFLKGEKYSCATVAETVKELVYIKTGEKVE